MTPKPKGWTNHPIEHGLARKGIKTKLVYANRTSKTKPFFTDLTADEMEQVSKLPHYGLKVGDKVKLSSEEGIYFDNEKTGKTENWQGLDAEVLHLLPDNKLYLKTSKGKAVVPRSFLNAGSIPVRLPKRSRVPKYEIYEKQFKTGEQGRYFPLTESRFIVKKDGKIIGRTAYYPAAIKMLEGNEAKVSFFGKRKGPILI
jgi:hypothetical protein